MKTQMTKLENGITIINAQRDSQMVYIKFIFGVGSSDEDPTNFGIAHFLEHMMFAGTKSRTKEQILNYAADFATEFNASTGMFGTTYKARCLKEYCSETFELFSDMLQNSLFATKDISKEKDIVRQEIIMRSSKAEAKEFLAYNQTRFSNNFVKRSVAGTLSNIKYLSRMKLVDFYNRFYCKRNLTIVTSGGISIEQTTKLVQKYFTNMPIGVQNVRKPLVYQGGIKEHGSKKESYNTRISFAAEGNVDFAASEILGIILGGGTSSRLFVNVREKLGLVYSIGGGFSYSSFCEFNVSAQSTAGNFYKVIESICKEIKDLQTNLVSDEELKKAKMLLWADIVECFEDNVRASNIISNYYTVNSKCFDIKELKTQIDNVKKEDLLNIAKKVFSSKPTYFINGKLKNKPSYDELCQMLKA